MNLDERLRRAAKDVLDAYERSPVPPLAQRRRHLGAQLVALSVAAGLVAAVVIVVARLDSPDKTNVSSNARGGVTEQSGATPPTPGSDSSLFDRGPLTPRDGHSVIWTGEEAIVWGGWGSEHGRNRRADGAAYNPTTRRWRMIAPSPLSGRHNHAAAWTGTEMLIVGGDGTRDGAAYDPVSDTWRRLPDAPFPLGSIDDETALDPAVFIDNELWVWAVSTDQAARYDSREDRWIRAAAPPFDDPADGVLRVVDGHLIAVGSSRTSTALVVARADLTTGAWTRLPDGVLTADELVPSIDPAWTAAAGDRLIAWSISSPRAIVVLDPESGAWTALDPHPLPSCESASGPISLGTRFLASSCGTAALFDPGPRTWRAVDLGQLQPKEREAVWTGSEVLVWGNACCHGTGDTDFDPNLAWRYKLPEDRIVGKLADGRAFEIYGDAGGICLDVDKVRFDCDLGGTIDSVSPDSALPLYIANNRRPGGLILVVGGLPTRANGVTVRRVDGGEIVAKVSRIGTISFWAAALPESYLGTASSGPPDDLDVVYTFPDGSEKVAPRPT
jgi:hypothetical protein